MLKLILFFSVLPLLVGCNSEEEVIIDESLPVTVHFAIEDSIGDDEWQDFITVTINSENIVTDVVLNSVTPLANNLRRDIAQLAGFEDAFGYNFYEQATSLERSLIGISSNDLADALLDAYDDGTVDFVTKKFADLADRALNTEPVVRGSYIDGAYHSIKTIDEDEDDYKLQYFVNFFVLNGNIAAVHFNAFYFRDDIDVNEWRQQAQILEKALISIQDPKEFTFDDDGFTTDIPGVYIEIKPFVSLVIQALADGPVVINLNE